MQTNLAWTSPLDALYSAVGEPTLWNTALDALCETLQAGSALLFTPCPQLLDLPHHHSKNYSLETAKDYIAHFVADDVYTMAALSSGFMRCGGVITGEALVPMTQLKQTRFFNDFLIKHNQGHLLTSMPFSPNNQHQLLPVVLSFYRPIKQNAFTEDDVETLNKLMPHVQRAWLLHDQAVKYKSLNHTMEAALNQLSHGLLILGSAGEMQFANHIAKGFLSALYLYELKTKQDASVTLPKSIISVANMATTEKLICKRIALGQGDDWYVVAMPSSHIASLYDLNEQPNTLATIIWLTKDGLDSKTNVDLIAELFKLTSAESKVLALLLKNQSPRQIADKLDNKIGTIRSHLGAILIKTNTKRQQDLIRLASAFEFIETLN